MKTCRKCGKTKHLDDFHVLSSSNDGHQPRCKVCARKATKEWREAKGNIPLSPEQSRANLLKSKFNITVEQYDNMLAEQDNRCAICNRHQLELTRRFAVDHDHEFGYIRGLLCSICNTSLGGFKDSVEILKSAIAYLESHEV